MQAVWFTDDDAVLGWSECRMEMSTPDTRLSRDGPPLRIREVMARTGLSRWTILRALERGDIVGFRIVPNRGSPWLFKSAVVAAWLDARKSE